MKMVFWDVESSNNKPNGFTQILSISAILTDADFNIIEQFEEECRLNKFLAASTYALLVNGFIPQELKQKQSNYEMARVVKNKFDHWIKSLVDGEEIIWIAYNNSFDSTLLRYLFYNNLFISDMYMLSTLPSCEFDGLKFAHALGSLSKNFKKTISDETGKVSFRLDGVSKENSIKIEGRAHTAIVDCFTLLNFIRKFSKSDPEIFKSLINTSHKTKVNALLTTSNDFFININYFGGKEYIYPLKFIGFIPNNANAALFLDLSKCDKTIIDLDKEELKKLYNRKSPKLFRTIYINKNPILINKSLIEDYDSKLFSLSELTKLSDLITANTEFKNKILSISESTDNFFNEVHYEYAEEAIYAAFFNNDDKAQTNNFHAETDWSNKKKIIKSFKDPRLIELAMNLVLINSPEALTEVEEKRVGQRLATRVSNINTEAKSKWVTVENARAEVDSARNKYEEEEDAEKMDMLKKIDDYLDEIDNEIKKYL